MLGSIFIPAAFTEFSIWVTESLVRVKFLRKINWAATFVIAAFSYSHYFIKRLEPALQFNFWPRPGVVFYLFHAFFAFNVIFSCVLLFNKWRASSGTPKIKFGYLFLAAVIGFGGGMTNHFLWYGIPVPPFGNIGVGISLLIIFYAILRYRLLGLNIAITRAGIFGFVYFFVLGIPFWVGHATKIWFYSTFMAVFLATLGPFIYNYLRQRAEDILLKEQRRYQQTLLRASRGMTLVKELDKLLNLIVHIITKAIRLKYAAMYIFDKNTDTFRLKVRRGQPADECATVHTDSLLLKFILEHKKPITIEGLDELSGGKNTFNYKNLKQEMNSLSAAVLVPSVVGNQLLAFLVLGEKVSGHYYSEDDLNVFSILANQASLAIENAIFYEETGKTMAEKFREHRLWSLGKMGSGIGHQINNRFAVITFKLDALRLSDVEKLRHAKSDSERKDLIKAIEDVLLATRNEALRGGEIATTLTGFARDTTGFKGVSLEDVIKGATNLLSCKFNLTELNLNVDLPKGGPPVLGNLSQLQDVFMNIIDNAHDAMLKREAEIEAGNLKHEGSFATQMTITCRTEANNWRIKIKDNGIGMKEEELKQLFIPFFTTKATSEKGTGLGLSIIKQIIDVHKGDVKIESAYGEGTTFFITLPVFVEK